jgi:hypothetical protein
MATVALGLPIFEGREEDDLGRFIELYKGYLHSLGINPAAEGGPPAGWEKGMGILRACMKGPAADWYDNNILGRRVKLRNIIAQLVHGNEAGWKALAFGAGANVPVNSWLAGSPAAAYAGAGANAANLITDVWPDYALEVNDEIWRTRAGMELTDDPLNYVTGAQGGGAIAGGGAGVGHAYVIPLHPCHALIKLCRDFPTQQDARRRLHFGNLFQENSTVRDFYTSVRKNGHLLGFDNQVIRNQFLRGLSPENVVEVQRLGADRPLDELVNALEGVEKSKEEMYRGQKYQEAHRRLKQTQVQQAVNLQTPQEPVILKPVTQHGITQEEMDQMLKKQADTFQAQIWELQKSLRQRPVQKPPVIKKSPTRRVIYDDGHDDSYDPYYDERPDEPTEEEASQWTEEDVRRHNRRWDEYNRRWNFDEKRERDLANKIARKLKLAKARREDAELSQAMRDLTLEDNSMDVDVVRGKLELVEDEDGSISIVRTGKKK